MAAQQKNDEDILLKIRDQDLVAIEARYHQHCYSTYTRGVKISTDEANDDRSVFLQSLKQVVVSADM